LTAQAVNQALADAGLQARQVEAAYFANTVQGALEGQLMVRGQMALRPLGFEGIPIVNVENACASASTALNLAYTAIKAGAIDIALAVGVDKMVVADKQAMLGVFDGAWDVHETERSTAQLLAMGAGVATPNDVIELPKRSLFMDVYSSFAKVHMAAFGTTQRQIAMVAAKNHTNASRNPLAQYQTAMTTDDVLAATTVVWPLTLPMCAPVSDGAAAAVLVSGKMFARLGLSSRAVAIKASVVLTGVTRKADRFDQHLCAIGAVRAYEQAGAGPGDMHVAEVHDATAFAEIQQSENLGFCEFGGGGPLVESNATALGGRIPINVSGGLEAKGHPIGATGLAQIHELVTQLRHEAAGRQVPKARLAIAENGGGLYGIEEAVAALTILEAPPRR
jgi:acetyl-CoA acyltransferase